MCFWHLLHVEPAYYLSLFTIPTDVANRTEKLQRNFCGWFGWWVQIPFGGVGYSLLSYCQWSLGAKKLGSFNQALVGKWSWRFGTDDTFTETGNSYELCWKWWGWISEPFRGTHGCSLWKSIRAGWDRLISYLSFDVGDGNCVQFWYDHWCGNHPLKEFFPSTSAHFV